MLLRRRYFSVSASGSGAARRIARRKSNFYQTREYLTDHFCNGRVILLNYFASSYEHTIFRREIPGQGILVGKNTIESSVPSYSFRLMIESPPLSVSFKNSNYLVFLMGSGRHGNAAVAHHNRTRRCARSCVSALTEIDGTYRVENVTLLLHAVPKRRKNHSCTENDKQEEMSSEVLSLSSCHSVFP